MLLVLLSVSLHACICIYCHVLYIFWCHEYIYVYKIFLQSWKQREGWYLQLLDTEAHVPFGGQWWCAGGGDDSLPHLGTETFHPRPPSVMLPHIHSFHPWLLQYSICLLMCCIKMPSMWVLTARPSLSLSCISMRVHTPALTVAWARIACDPASKNVAASQSGTSVAAG